MDKSRLNIASICMDKYIYMHTRANDTHVIRVSMYGQPTDTVTKLKKIPTPPPQKKDSETIVSVRAWWDTWHLLINEHRLIEMAFVPFNLYPILLIYSIVSSINDRRLIGCCVVQSVSHSSGIILLDQSPFYSCHLYFLGEWFLLFSAMCPLLHRTDLGIH